MKKKLQTLFLSLALITNVSISFAQSACDLGNYTNAFTLSANDYPYFSPSTGITVDAMLVGVQSYPNFTYTCGGQSFATVTPAFALDAPNQSLTFTFSAPVTSFSIIVNGTNTGEEFYFSASTGTVVLSNFCTADFTAINGGQDLVCTTGSSATGTLITINNSVGATSYTMTHNGAEFGSRYALLDCFVSQPTTSFTASKLCFGDSTAFNLSSNNPIDSVLWNFDDLGSGIFNTSSDTAPTHIFSNPGVYNVSLITYFTGSSDTTMMSITINPLPSINLGNDTTLCAGESLALDATTPGATYSWQDNSTNPTFDISQPGTYWVTVSVNNCEATDSITVSYEPLPSINLGNDTTLCTGESLILDATTLGATYSWQDNSTNPTFNVTQQGTYWVTITVNGCEATDTIDVNFDAAPTVDLGNDTTLCEGEAMTLNATTSGATYLWQDNSTNSTFNVTQQGTYWVTVTVNSCSMSDTDTINVNFNPLPIVDLGNDTILCQGETLNLDANTPGATYLWQDNSTNSTFNVTQQGTYSVVVTVNNCSPTDMINVNYVNIPTLNLGNDTTLCTGETLNLDASTPGATFLWQDNSTNSTFNVTQQGTYWVTVTINNCSTSDTIDVNFNPTPTPDLGNDTTLCQGETLLLNAIAAGATYLWQDNSTNPTFNVTQQGTYSVIVTVNNCSATDMITINFNPSPTFSLGNDTTLCDKQTLVLDATTPGASYLWQDNSLLPTFNVTDPGAYWVEVTLNNCIKSDTIAAFFNPLPLVSLGNDTTICAGDILTLYANAPDATSFLWFDGSESSIANVNEADSYWIQAMNGCGIHSDTIRVELEDCNCELYIANAFTPNGDNLNDFFAPATVCQFIEYNFSIFDRWGTKLYETNDPQGAWNGTYLNKVVSGGVYVYIVKFKFDDREKSRQEVRGKVTVLR